MQVRTEIGTRQLSDLIKQVQAGDEIILTQGSKPVAKLVFALEKEMSPNQPFRIRSIKGHRVLRPLFSQGELADEMFSRP